MLATDNHIGYMERDPVRGQDSINTFREILQLAVKHDVRLDVFYRATARPNVLAGGFYSSGRRSLS
jgi:hypothetical protein